MAELWCSNATTTQASTLSASSFDMKGTLEIMRRMGAEQREWDEQLWLTTSRMAIKAGMNPEQSRKAHEAIKAIINRYAMFPSRPLTDDARSRFAAEVREVFSRIKTECMSVS